MFTNETNIPISLAVWLCHDDYDHATEPNTISATSLLKPLQALILARRNRDLTKRIDVAALIPSRMGTALHSAIETAWQNKDKVSKILTELGYSSKVIENILINPDSTEISIESLCIYMEQRSHKQVGKYIISGKFDFVVEGVLEDFKSTGTYNYISGSNVEKYKQQGSIYRWLNPEIITEDYMRIQYIFTDWSKVKARQSKDYPQSRLLEQKIQLMTITETQTFIDNIITKITKHEENTTLSLPLCTPEELWKSPAIHKYYKDPTKKVRATKNFDVYEDALMRLHKDGNVGEIVTYPGEVKRCGYCDVVDICPQAQTLIQSGELTL